MKPVQLCSLALLLLSSLSQAADTLTLTQGLALRAQLVASQSSQLAAGMSGRITRLSVRPGDEVRKGESLVRFDCAAQRARHKIAGARLKASQVELKAQQNMLEYSSASPLEVELAKANVDVMRKEQQAVAVDLQHCQLNAPFSGVISKRFSNPYQFVNSGEPLLELINPEQLEVQLVVPSNWLRWLKTGIELTMNIDEIGQTLAGTVTRLGGQIDPVSQTVEVFGQLSQHDPRQRPGMSGTVKLQVPQ